VSPLGVLLPLLAAGLGLTVWALARRDLRGMDAHVIDPAGRRLTRRGQRYGLLGAAGAVLQVLVFAADFAANWYR
jgi:hypothetical protein